MLQIDIRSFGYHRSGIPGDTSGNGGGYVFDCRALPNPVYDPTLAPLAGVHDEVCAWFAANPDVDTYIRNAVDLVLFSVRSYLDRSYLHMQVSFGCTGGQHRSVYCAEQVTARLRAALPADMVVVRLVHTEEGRWWNR
jgi:RNase adapter protein RapZ